jgi:hypothetical protein
MIFGKIIVINNWRQINNLKTPFNCNKIKAESHGILMEKNGGQRRGRTRIINSELRLLIIGG